MKLNVFNSQNANNYQIETVIDRVQKIVLSLEHRDNMQSLRFLEIHSTTWDDFLKIIIIIIQIGAFFFNKHYCAIISRAGSMVCAFFIKVLFTAAFQNVCLGYSPDSKEKVLSLGQQPLLSSPDRRMNGLLQFGADANWYLFVPFGKQESPCCH